MAGKGDKRRPSQVSDEQWADNWNRIFTKQSSGSNSGSGNSGKSHTANARTTKGNESKAT